MTERFFPDHIHDAATGMQIFPEVSAFHYLQGYLESAAEMGIDLPAEKVRQIAAEMKEIK